MGNKVRNSVRVTALALAFGSLGGCMLDPLYAVYAVAGVGDDDSSAAAAYAPAAAPVRRHRVWPWDPARMASPR